MVEQRSELLDELVGLEPHVAAEPGARVCVTPPTAKCAPALMRSFAGILSASPAYWPDSIAKSAADSARLRAITELASCVLNSRCPMRASSAMVRAMLAIPARDCSCPGTAATAAWVVAATSATTQSKTPLMNSSLSAKLS